METIKAVSQPQSPSASLSASQPALRSFCALALDAQFRGLRARLLSDNRARAHTLLDKYIPLVTPNCGDQKRVY